MHVSGFYSIYVLLSFGFLVFRSKSLSTSTDGGAFRSSNPRSPLTNRPRGPPLPPLRPRLPHPTQASTTRHAPRSQVADATGCRSSRGCSKLKAPRVYLSFTFVCLNTHSDSCSIGEAGEEREGGRKGGGEGGR